MKQAITRMFMPHPYLIKIIVNILVIILIFVTSYQYYVCNI